MKTSKINSDYVNFMLLSRFSRVRLCVTPRQPTRLPRPWDSPGKNTGVGCRFLLQCMKVKSESEVAQSCTTLRDPMDCSLPGSSIHRIFQARVLEWGAIAFSQNIVDLCLSNGGGWGFLADLAPENSWTWWAVLWGARLFMVRQKHPTNFVSQQQASRLAGLTNVDPQQPPSAPCRHCK